MHDSTVFTSPESKRLHPQFCWVDRERPQQPTTLQHIAQYQQAPSAWNHRQLGRHFDSRGETVDASPPHGDSANSGGWWPTATGRRPWPISHGHCCALAKHIALRSRAPRAHHSLPRCPGSDLLYYVHPSKVKVSNFQGSLFFQIRSLWASKLFSIL